MVVALILGQEIFEVVVLVLDRADLIVLVDEVTGNKILAAALQVRAFVMEDTNPSSVILAGNSGSLGRPDQRRQNMMKRLDVVIGRVYGQVLEIANGILEGKRGQRATLWEGREGEDWRNGRRGWCVGNDQSRGREERRKRWKHQTGRIVSFCQSACKQTIAKGRVVVLEVVDKQPGAHNSANGFVFWEGTKSSPASCQGSSLPMPSPTEQRIHDWMPLGGNVSRYPDVAFTVNVFHAVYVCWTSPPCSQPSSSVHVSVLCRFFAEQDDERFSDIFSSMERQT